MLKVTMHWYAFQILTIRFVCGSGVCTWNFDNRRSHSALSCSKALSTLLGCKKRCKTGRTLSFFMVCEPGSANLSAGSFSW